MTNPKVHRADKQPTSDRAAAAVDGTPSGTLLAIVWVALAAYLVLFFWTPLEGVQAVSQTLVRRWELLQGLFFPDQALSAWFQETSWQALGKRVAILGGAGAIFLVASAAGWIGLRLARLDRALSRLETFVFSAGAGLNAVSLVTLALGLLGAMWWWAFAGLGGAIVAVAIILARRGDDPPATPGAAHGVAAGESTSPSAFRVETPALLWLGAPFVLVILLGAMLPPIDFDVREYHLQAPKEFYQQGQITFLEHNVYANMPLGSEMLSLAGMIVCRDWWFGALVGKTLVALFAPLTALTLVVAGRRFATPSAGNVAALVYISTPWIARVSMHGLVEGVFGYYLFAAVTAVLFWQNVRAAGRCDGRFLALAGFLAGAAVSTKYPAVLFCVLPLTAWIVYWSLAGAAAGTPRPAPWNMIRLPVTFLLFVALGCGLWLAKNAYFTGNPVYPLLYDVFGGQTRTTEKNDQWNRAHDAPNFRASDLAARAAGITLESDWLSPLMMPLTALGVLFARRRLAWWLAAYFAYVFAAWWLFTHRIDRFWVPILPVVALVAGIGATWTSARWWRVPFVVLLVFGLAANFVMITSPLMGDNRYLADLNLLREDPYRVDPWHLYLNEHAEHVRGALLVADAQPFDLEVPASYNTVFDDSVFEQLARGRTAEETRRALAARNISHVYANWNEVARYRSPGNYGITRFIAPEVFDRLVDSGVLARVPPIKDNANEMYRVMPSSPERADNRNPH